VNTADYYVDVYVRDTKNLEGTDRNTFHTSWTAPAAPAFTVDSAFYDSLGYVKITWTNAATDVDFISYRVYRRLYDASGPTYGSWILLYEDQVDQPTYEFRDWLATAATSYQYAVVQVADRFGAAIESVYTPTAVTVDTDKYWFIHPLDETLSISLSVNEDDFKEVYEEEEFHVLGRGRHVDYGDRLGYEGSLSLQMRDKIGATARQQRLALQTLKQDQIPVYMRNPFGDLWLINLKDLSFTRMAGMGKHEAVNVQLGYVEVAP
jgi:hypothetical protein